MRRRATRSVMAVLAFVLSAPPAAAEEVVVLDTRPGVRQEFVVLQPPGTPAASVLLLAGGNGFIRNRRDPQKLNNNFLIRSRAMFARHGLLVAALDVPSDRRADGLAGWRDSAEHRTDIAAVVRWLRARAAVPVWLVGTSRGSVSAAFAAESAGADGVVLSSSVTRPSRRDPSNVMDAALGRIGAPVLIVSHRRDGCVITPPEDGALIRRALTAAPRVEIRMFDGGDAPRSGPCEAMAEHGFLGIESEVVAAIAAWIKAPRQN